MAGLAVFHVTERSILKVWEMDETVALRLPPEIKKNLPSTDANDEP